jgi:tetratricopeptide (TPR) repeat protein
MDKEALAYQQDPNLDETEQFRFIWLRGLMHQGVGKIEESAKIWQDGLNLIADSVDIQYFAGDLIDNIHFHLSMQAIRAGNMDLAHKYLKQFKQNDDPTEYSEAKALILTAKGKSKKAIHNLWESIKERPTDESYYKTLVEIYQKSEQTELIIDTWINCLTHSPEYGMGMRELVKLLPNSTRPDAQELLVVYKNKLASWEKAVLGLKAKLI